MGNLLPKRSQNSDEDEGSSSRKRTKSTSNDQSSGQTVAPKTHLLQLPKEIVLMVVEYATESIKELRLVSLIQKMGLAKNMPQRIANH